MEGWEGCSVEGVETPFKVCFEGPEVVQTCRSEASTQPGRGFCIWRDPFAKKKQEIIVVPSFKLRLNYLCIYIYIYIYLGGSFKGPRFFPSEVDQFAGGSIESGTFKKPLQKQSVSGSLSSSFFEAGQAPQARLKWLGPVPKLS